VALLISAIVVLKGKKKFVFFKDIKKNEQQDHKESRSINSILVSFTMLALLALCFHESIGDIEILITLVVMIIITVIDLWKEA
jgi:hypothetical protein